MGSQRVGHDWATNTHIHPFFRNVILKNCLCIKITWVTFKTLNPQGTCQNSSISISGGWTRQEYFQEGLQVIIIHSCICKLLPWGSICLSVSQQGSALDFLPFAVSSPGSTFIVHACDGSCLFLGSQTHSLHYTYAIGTIFNSHFSEEIKALWN